MLTLYFAPGTIAVASAIALTEAGLPFETRVLDFGAAEQRGAAYHKVNPKGRVPALDTPDGILTETGAILEYIAAHAPDAGLVPADAMAAARMREVMYYIATTVHVAHAHKMRGHRWATDPGSWQDMQAKVTENMRDCAEHIEAHGLAGPYVMGERLSLADPYLFVIGCWLPGDGVALQRYPGWSRFMAAMEARASVQAIRATGMI